ncbi:MAG: hypothetical protein WAT96_08125 [Streptococcus suis]
MATKVFISFRFSDGKEIKDELVDLFDESTEVDLVKHFCNTSV